MENASFEEVGVVSGFHIRRELTYVALNEGVILGTGQELLFGQPVNPTAQVTLESNSYRQENGSRIVMVSIPGQLLPTGCQVYRRI